MTTEAKEKLLSAWHALVAVLFLAVGAGAALAAVHPGVADSSQDAVTKQLLHLAWGAIAILAGVVSVLIGVVWAQLNRRLRQDEESTRELFATVKTKIDSAAMVRIVESFDRFDARFQAHEVEDRERYDRLIDRHDKLLELLNRHQSQIVDALTKALSGGRQQ